MIQLSFDRWLGSFIILLWGCAKREVSPPPDVATIAGGGHWGPADVALTGVWKSPSGKRSSSPAVEQRTSRVSSLELRDNKIRHMATPPGPMLWWVSGIDDQHIWACGDGGRILRFDGERWEEEDTGLEKPSCGVYGPELKLRSGRLAALFVGGGPKGILLFSEETAVEARIDSASLPQTLNLYKVWGDGQAVFAVGEGGTIVVSNESGIVTQESDTDSLLFTIDGQPEARCLQWVV